MHPMHYPLVTKQSSMMHSVVDSATMIEAPMVVTVMR
jgi:hypothetical protein